MRSLLLPAFLLFGRLVVFCKSIRALAPTKRPAPRSQLSRLSYGNTPRDAFITVSFSPRAKKQARWMLAEESLSADDLEEQNSLERNPDQHLVMDEGGDKPDEVFLRQSHRWKHISKKNARSRRNYNRNYNGSNQTHHHQKLQQQVRNREWLRQATENLLRAEMGTLGKGKWHEVVSMMSAWSSLARTDPDAPPLMEALLKRLVEEQRHGNSEVHLSIALYNSVLDAWACAALFRTHGVSASQRAREILVLLQETYEQTQDPSIRPDAESFDLVLHVVVKTEGALIARRLLAWMEYLSKSNKNVAAAPTKSDYIMVLDAYAQCRTENAGKLAEGFLRHMIATGRQPNTLCCNIAIKAWTRSKRGRESAEHAERILEEMEAEPDLVTYGSVIAAWAASGMQAHAVSRAEEILRKIEEHETMEANTVVLNAVMSTWVKSRNPAAVERTEEILRQMELSDHAQPDLFSFNTHLHALSMHGRIPGNARKAEELLRRMEEAYDSGRLAFGPNLFSYNLVIEAYCRSGEPGSTMMAASVLRRLVKRDGVMPDAFSFNQVLAALGKGSSPGAAHMAEELLLYMDEAHRSGLLPYAKPDEISYSSVIVGFARSGVKGAAERAQRLFDRMKERYDNGERDMKPGRICYNALINCWARSGEGTLGARKAEALLQEMQEQHEAGDESMAPNIVTFNSVLNAWARSGTRCCGNKAETYLNKMWELYKAGDHEVKPNDLSYNTVINAISKSKNQGKAQKALRVLRRMDKLYQSGYKDARPNEVTYTAVLNSCAFPAVVDPRTRRKALDTALFTLKELQESRYGRPNQVTYGTFIKACGNLLHDDEDTKRAILRCVFDQCCKDGQVGGMVLAQLRHAAPPDLYDELLAEFVQSDDTVSVDTLPLAWRCNVRSSRHSRVKTRLQVKKMKKDERRYLKWQR